MVNFLVLQNTEKHDLADSIYQKTAQEQSLFMSFLVLHKISFVLGKLNLPVVEIKAKVNALALLRPYAYQLEEYHRAVYLAERIGFQHFNDCLHTAIAEKNCTELFSFNRSDFSKIRSYTDLKIRLL